MRCGKKQENCATGRIVPAKCLKQDMYHQPPSPCNSICRLDPGSGFCLGCMRTLDEIADWPILSPLEKRSLMELLDRRWAEGGAPGNIAGN